MQVYISNPYGNIFDFTKRQSVKYSVCVHIKLECQLLSREGTVARRTSGQILYHLRDSLQV
jgi:hypothetical protein